ncbi:MAG: Fic family protein [Patescibacteria group bacterium]
MANRFDIRLNSLNPLLWQKIARVDELKGQWKGGSKLHPSILTQLKKSTLITSTGSSTRIEGSSMSDMEIEKLMAGISLRKLSNRDEQEVKGYYELLHNVFLSWDKIKFSESCLKHFHKEMLKYAEKDVLHKGDYKKRKNQEMRELTDWTLKSFANNSYHPLLIIGNFVVEFLLIHPFEDGNGRLSRILTNFLMLKASYAYVPYFSHEKLIENSKSNYYIALRKSQQTLKTAKEDISAWLDFFLTITLKQAEQAVDFISNENRADLLLSKRQAAILELLQKIKEASPKEIFKNTKIPRPTINQGLTKLIKIGKIQRLGLGRAVRYRLIV